MIFVAKLKFDNFFVALLYMFYKVSTYKWIIVVILGVGSKLAVFFQVGLFGMVCDSISRFDIFPSPFSVLHSIN